LSATYQKFTRDILTIGGARIVVALSGVIMLPLITKYLGAYDYGIWSQFSVTLGLLWTLSNLGLPFAMTRFLAAVVDREQIREQFYSVLAMVFIISAGISALMVAFPGPFARAFFDGATQVITIIGAVVLLSSLREVYLAFFRTFRHMKTYSVFLVVDNYVQLGVIAYLVARGHGITAMLLTVLVTRAVTLLVLFFMVKARIGIKRPRFSRIKEYLRFGVPVVPGSLSSWVVGSSDRYVIAYFMGVGAVGIYSAAYALGSLIIMAAGVFTFVLPPTLSKLFDEGRLDEVKTHLSYSLKYLLALAIPFVFGAGILSIPVLRMFSTAEIASQGYSVMPLIALSTLAYIAYTPLVQPLILVKKTKIVGVIWIVSALANLGLNILLVPRLGILGAALPTLIAYGLALGLTGYYSRKEFTFAVDWRFIAKSLLASAVMSLVIWRMAPQGTRDTILTAVAGCGAYAAALLLLRGITRKEIDFFRGLFQKS
jgi:O-antigen/teichoic acid export membrane protein